MNTLKYTLTSGEIPDKNVFKAMARDGTLFQYANTIDTHYNKHTANEDIISDMDRLIEKTEEKRNNNLTFSRLAESHFEPNDTNVEDIDDYVNMVFGDAMCLSADSKNKNILDMLENAKYGETVSISITMTVAGYDSIGKGVRYDRPSCAMQEVETPIITMVLKRDRSSYVGFNLVTAYPNLNHEKAVETGRDISRELSQVPSYQKLNVITQMYYKTAVSDSTIKPTYNCHGRPTLYYKIPRNDEPYDFDIVINDSSMICYTCSKTGHKHQGVNPLNQYSPYSHNIYEANMLKKAVNDAFQEMLPEVQENSDIQLCRNKLKQYLDYKQRTTNHDRQNRPMPKNVDISINNYENDGKTGPNL